MCIQIALALLYSHNYLDSRIPDIFFVAALRRRFQFHIESHTSKHTHQAPKYTCIFRWQSLGVWVIFWTWHNQLKQDIFYWQVNMFEATMRKWIFRRKKKKSRLLTLRKTLKIIEFRRCVIYVFISYFIEVACVARTLFTLTLLQMSPISTLIC